MKLADDETSPETDPEQFLAGASAGVYALIVAHVATLLLNWQEDGAVKIRKVVQRPITRIVRIVLITLLTLNDLANILLVTFLMDEKEVKIGQWVLVVYPDTRFPHIPTRQSFLLKLCGHSEK